MRIPEAKVAPLFFVRQSGVSGKLPVGLSNAYFICRIILPGDDEKSNNYIRIFNRFFEVLAFDERMRTSVALVGSFIHTQCKNSGDVQAEASRRSSCSLHRQQNPAYYQDTPHKTNSNFPELTASITPGPAEQNRQSRMRNRSAGKAALCKQRIT